MSRPTWRVYEVRSNSCSLAAEHDLDLLDRAAVAVEAVVDAAADEPAAELGERPVERRALADRRRGGAGTRPGRAGSSWRLATASSALAPEVDLERAGEERLAAGRPRSRRPTDRAPRRSTPSAPVAELDERPRRAARGPAAPAAQRTTIGRSSRTPAGTSDRDALVPDGRGSAGRACRRRAAARRRRAARAATAGVAPRAPRRASRDRRRPRAAGVEDERRRRRPRRGRRAPAAPVGQRSPAIAVGGAAGPAYGRHVGEVGRAQVDVRRVELVRLDRQRRRTASNAARRSAREPVRLARSAASASTRRSSSGSVERSRSRRGAPAGRRARSRSAVERHPSDPSISSFTSRLNSIAYSIGSSLVNTSRKPWTMRFCASFSVRPRLIR